MENLSRAFSYAAAVDFVAWMFCPDIVDKPDHWNRCAEVSAGLAMSLAWNGADTDCKHIAEFCGEISCGCLDS